MEEDQVIEIGAVKVKNGKIAGKYNCIIYPEREVSDFIIRLTGITRKMLDGGIPMREGVEGFLAFSEGYPVLGHNLMFDYRFMKTAAKRFHYAFEKEGVEPSGPPDCCFAGWRAKSFRASVSIITMSIRRLTGPMTMHWQQQSYLSP